MNQDNLYQFPATRFVCNPVWRQWWHLVSEVLELGWELLRRNWQRAANESWDISQDQETMRRILAGRGADVALARETIIGNNRERGYYIPKGSR